LLLAFTTLTMNGAADNPEARQDIG